LGVIDLNAEGGNAMMCIRQGAADNIFGGDRLTEGSKVRLDATLNSE